MQNPFPHISVAAPSALLLVLLALPPAPSFSAEPPRTLPPVLEGRALVTTLAEYHTPPTSPVRVVYEGRWTMEAHLAKPHDTMVRATRLTLLDDCAARARLDWATWREKTPAEVEVETTWLDGERIVHRDSAASTPFLASGVRAALLRARVEAAAPWRLVGQLRGEQVTAIDGTNFTVRASAAGVELTRRFTWERSTRSLRAAALPFAHARTGDALDATSWADWSKREGVCVPGTLRIDAPGGASPTGSAETFDLHLVRVEKEADVARALEVPANAPAKPDPADPQAMEISVEEFAPGLVSFASRALDARTVVLEFADHCLAIDAPLSSALGERVVAAIQRRFPQKPLRFVLFGHHHPHYTGGLRAFVAAGATVVAPPQNARYAAEIIARPFKIEPDAWARVQTTPKIESFSGRRVFTDGSQRLEVIDIGARSSHTDEYLVFYLPRARLLIQDDIGWFAAKDGKLGFGARSKGLRDSIVEHGLEVQTLWQVWPVTSKRPSITFAELDEGVIASQTPRPK